MTVFADSSRFIIDLGMKTGEDTAYFLARGYEVVAVDADPERAAAVRARFAPAITGRRLTVVEAAIAVDVAQSDHDAPQPVCRIHAPGTNVPCLMLSDLFDRFGTPLYLKVDVADSTRIVLAQLLQQLVKPLYVGVKDTGDGLSIISTLGDCGYNGFQLLSLAKLPMLRDDRLPSFVFAPTSMGPFDGALPDSWLSQGEVESFYTSTVATRDGKRIAPLEPGYVIHAARL